MLCLLCVSMYIRSYVNAFIHMHAYMYTHKCVCMCMYTVDSSSLLCACNEVELQKLCIINRSLLILYYYKWCICMYVYRSRCFTFGDLRKSTEWQTISLANWLKLHASIGHMSVYQQPRKT